MDPRPTVPPDPSEPGASPAAGPRALLATGLIFLAVHGALTWLLPPGGAWGWRFWGGNALRYLEPWFSLLWFAAGVAAVFVVALRGDRLAGEAAPARPAGNREDQAHAENAALRGLTGAPGDDRNEFDTGAARTMRGPAAVLGGAVAVMAAAAIVFVLLGSRYALLGDNLLRAREAEAGIGPPSESGIMKLFAFLASTWKAGAPGSGEAVMGAVSIAAGSIFAASAWWWSLRARGPSASLGMTFFALLSGGFVALFCRYIEVYPLPLALLFLATIAAERAAQGRGSAAVALILLAICIFLHRVSLLWLPALAAPMALRGTGIRTGIPTSRAASWIFGTTAAGAVAAVILAGRSSFLLDLLPTPDRAYTVFSIPHLSDFLNAQFLGSPLGLLAGMALVSLLRPPRIPAGTVILALAWLCPVTALFFFRPLLGGADWDILALATPFAALFCVRVLGRSRPRLLLLAAVLSAWNTLPWLAVQSSTASVDRVRDLVNSDQADYYRTHPAPLHLAFLFAANGLGDLQQKELLRGTEEWPEDPRFSHNLALLARARGSWDEAERHAETAYRIQPAYIAPLDILYEAYRRRGDRSRQARAGSAILEAAAQRPEMAGRYFSPSRLEEIRRELRMLEQPR